VDPPLKGKVTTVNRTLRAFLASSVLAAALAFAAPAPACPSCAASASPKDPNIWPVVGAFILVPWALAGGAVLLIRRESRSA
jgi:hypothetical protein